MTGSTRLVARDNTRRQNTQLMFLRNQPERLVNCSNTYFFLHHTYTWFALQIQRWIFTKPFLKTFHTKQKEKPNQNQEALSVIAPFPLMQTSEVSQTGFGPFFTMMYAMISA